LLIPAAPAAAATDSSRTGDLAVAASGAVSARPSVTVDGAVAHPLILRAEDLARFGSHHVDVDYRGPAGEQHHRCRGAALLDILKAAKPRFDPDIKSDSFRYVVLVTAADGYQAVVSWGEIDPEGAGKQVLLAVSSDGVELPRPRLVVPGDAHGVRYVSGVTRIRLVRVGS
jgi:hypothetical protein